ncbi:carnitine acetyltransferase [Heliocybe sulcata]|uniref:Carnitine acetyltransferase n=1 Tax=Heliocybe sulcata TaxID=5364 RepID=A0A5C3N876_9AGAM|nr:carnitine acetyltransferase [Heliocybe sulcata]
MSAVADGKVAAGVDSRPSTIKMQRLPIPDLNYTLERWLKSVEPFLLEGACGSRGDVERGLQRRRDSLRDSIGPLHVLQERLIDLDRNSPYNWLDDNIWTKHAYLQWRQPILINSNWWLALFHDNTVPEHVLQGMSSEVHAGITPWQVRRASWLVHRLVDFKHRLDRQEIYAETTRAGTWYQHAFSKVFNMCRIPRSGYDVLPDPPAESSFARRQILVMLHDWFYSVEVVAENGSPIPVKEIEHRLRDIVRDAEGRIMNEEAAVPVGILTTDDRDEWAQKLQRLLSLSPHNQELYTIIKESLFALSLDGYTYGLTNNITGKYSSGSEIERDAHLHNIRSGVNGRNRFFDKGLTIIVENNTRCGATGEHAPVDALVPSIACEYAIIEGIDSKVFDNADPKVEFLRATEKAGGWRRLDWVTDESMEMACVLAEKNARAMIADSDNSVLWFTDYGADFVKNTLKLSPDAYIQMALQLAWYRTRHCFTAVYETALTRLFLHGRTETIRSFTSESREFVLAMGDASKTDVERCRLLSQAVQFHVRLTREAATGKGIDRHLLGLEYVRRPSDADHPLFRDPLYKLSTEWKLSTSGLSAGHLFRGTGFGTPYPDGYGINYLAAPDIIKFGIESKHSCPQTSTADFKAALADALMHMKTMILRALESSAARL